MTVRVRVRNFQSIADSTVEISGLTVVTGQNNSGKSALVRAIAAMATNESAKGLLRNGEKTLSVELAFDDGVEVKWEKGGTTNQYTLNGKVFSGVGAGVPEEIRALNLGPIEAGGQEIWPQVASQFKGSLFLLDKSGSVFAEAVSDVERVGLLAEASRKAESDARASKSEHKIRQKDAQELKATLRRYEGISEIESRIQEIRDLEQKLKKIADLANQFKRYQSLIEKHKSVIQRYSPVLEIQIPEIPSIEEGLWLLATRDRIHRHTKIIGKYSNLPEIPAVDIKAAELQELSALKNVIRASSKKASAKLPEINLPDVTPIEKFDRFIMIYRALKKAQQDLKSAQSLADEAASLYDSTSKEYTETLRELGTCPTCGNDCGDSHK
jgi:DNA repair exonuclease SbcCD ATPase subunit